MSSNYDSNQFITSFSTRHQKSSSMTPNNLKAFPHDKANLMNTQCFKRNLLDIDEMIEQSENIETEEQNIELERNTFFNKLKIKSEWLGSSSAATHTKSKSLCM